MLFLSLGLLRILPTPKWSICFSFPSSPVHPSSHPPVCAGGENPISDLWYTITASISWVSQLCSPHRAHTGVSHLQKGDEGREKETRMRRWDIHLGIISLVPRWHCSAACKSVMIKVRMGCERDKGKFCIRGILGYSPAEELEENLSGPLLFCHWFES